MIMKALQTIINYILFPSTSIKNHKQARTKLYKNLTNALTHKTILITGASYGIGEQLAYLLALPNTTLILLARTEDKLRQVQQRVVENGGHADIFSIDMRDEKMLNHFLNTLASKGISIDIFISNAGKSIKRPVMDSLDRLHDYQRTMAINYFAPVQLHLALIPQLAKNQGHIINISAVNVLYPPMPEWSAYQASKSAFDQWFRSASPELNAQSIATSTFYLPLVRTRMVAPTKMYDHVPAMTAEQVAVLIARTLLTRQSVFRPWWSYPVSFLAHLCNRPLTALLRWYYRHHYKKR